MKWGVLEPAGKVPRGEEELNKAALLLGTFIPSLEYRDSQIHGKEIQTILGSPLNVLPQEEVI